MSAQTGSARSAANERDGPDWPDRAEQREEDDFVPVDAALEGAGTSSPLARMGAAVIRAFVDPADGRQRRPQLNVHRTGGQVAIDVPVVDGSNGPLDDFNVLLRHRPPSIPAALSRTAFFIGQKSRSTAQIQSNPGQSTHIQPGRGFAPRPSEPSRLQRLPAVPDPRTRLASHARGRWFETSRAHQ